MNILFVSDDCIAINLGRVLQSEGHTVKLYIHNKRSRRNFDHILHKVESWKDHLNWVGKDGLIIFDDTGYGKEQDNLRKKGYNVFGGCALGDKLEDNREFGQKIFKEYGLKTVPLCDFDNIDDAVCFIKENPAPWVVKHDGHDAKFLTYVGEFDDGRDVMSILRNYFQNSFINRNRVSLHKRVDGVEIGVGRYFNGKDWVGPIEMNVEHTKMFPSDMGPVTTEMGTLAWYDDNENNKLFVDVLDKLKPYLQKIDYRGDFEINCMVNETGAYPLEATARLGTPIIHIHSALHISKWGEFLLAIAQGKPYNLKYHKGFAVVNLLATPPFPYGQHNSKDNLFGVNIYFNDFTESEMKDVALEGVSLRKHGQKEETYYISNDDGYVMYTVGVGKTISEARDKSLKMARNIIIPKVFYRDDIGKKFECEDLPKLKKWGYIKKVL